MKQKAVLAYSGGLDTSIILKWLQRERDLEVTTLTVDLGQLEDLSKISLKSLQNGAANAFVVDARHEFISEYVFPLLRAMPLYEGHYLLGTSIARPLISRLVVKHALEIAAPYIVHGATGKGNDQIRFELGIAALAPALKVIAPWREWIFKGRSDLEAYAQENGIDVPTTPKSPWSYDGNIFHCSFEGGLLEDPFLEPPDELFRMTNNPITAPNLPEYIDIEFKGGDPIAVNGEFLQPVEMLTALNAVGGRHGVGRIDIVENRATGIKSRGVYETPGGTLIQQARRAIESLVLDAPVIVQRDKLAIDYASQVYNGLWFSPERTALQAYFDHVAAGVSGIAKLKIFKGSSWVIGRKSHDSLYQQTLASFDAEGDFNHAHADGFIAMMAQRLKTRANVCNSGGSAP